jgi:hypothetical protein
MKGTMQTIGIAALTPKISLRQQTNQKNQKKTNGEFYQSVNQINKLTHERPKANII